MVIQKTKNEIHKVLCNNCDLFIYLFFSGEYVYERKNCLFEKQHIWYQSHKTRCSGH